MRYERLAKQAEANMLTASEEVADPDGPDQFQFAHPLGLMLKFYMLHGFYLRLYASGLHFDGDLDAVRRNAKGIEDADFSDVFLSAEEDELN